MSAKLRISLAVAAFLAGAAGAVYYFRPKPASTPTPVAAAPAETEAILAGRIRAKTVVAVGAPIDGVLESVETAEGQEVFEGQLLARIKNTALDTRIEEAKIEVERLEAKLNGAEAAAISARLEASRAEADAARVKASLAAAQRNFSRQQTLLGQGATPRLTYEKAQKDLESLTTEGEAVEEIARQSATKVETAQKAVEEAKRLLADKNSDLEDLQAQLLETEVHAPVDGLLVGQKAAAGEEVKRDMKDLFQIAVDLTALELVAEATPSLAARLKPGQPALIQVVEAGGQALPATVEAVNGAQIVIPFTSPDPAVKPGLTAQARIALQ